jgi:segregation and condensation protein A
LGSIPKSFELVNYKVHLDIFEGPLDLLLHLVKKNEVEVTDIPISLITEQYLSTLSLMRELELDVAGEYLVMAATLIHIKSRMLLPAEAVELEEEEDPRTELVQQLLEYQKFKEAAYRLDHREILQRDVFVREPGENEDRFSGPRPFEAPSLFELLSAFREILKRTDQREFYAIQGDSASIQDRIHAILQRLQGGIALTFDTLFQENSDRRGVIVTFLAVLEVVRLRLVTIVQQREFGEIWLSLAVQGDSTAAIPSE